MIARIVIVSSFALVACAGDPKPGTSELDGALGADALIVRDAADSVRRLPAWQLEDVQPASPRAGQTYGVDSFTNRVIVVSLLEGF